MFIATASSFINNFSFAFNGNQSCIKLMACTRLRVRERVVAQESRVRGWQTPATDMVFKLEDSRGRAVRLECFLRISRTASVFPSEDVDFYCNKKKLVHQEVDLLQDKITIAPFYCDIMNRLRLGKVANAFALSFIFRSPRWASCLIKSCNRFFTVIPRRAQYYARVLYYR